MDNSEPQDRNEEITNPIKKRKRKVIILKKPKKPSVIDVDDIYKHVNQIQINRINISFKIDVMDVGVVDNILRDSELPFKKTIINDVVTYDVEPGPERKAAENALDDLEELDDEIFEEGQIFG